MADETNKPNQPGTVRVLAAPSAVAVEFSYRRPTASAIRVELAGPAAADTPQTVQGKFHGPSDGHLFVHRREDGGEWKIVPGKELIATVYVNGTPVDVESASAVPDERLESVLSQEQPAPDPVPAPQPEGDPAITGAGDGSNGGGLQRDGGWRRDGMREVMAYPLITQQATGPVAEGSIKARVHGELRTLLGAIPERPTAGFLLGALERNTQEITVQGTPTMLWSATRAGSGAVPAGELAGRQAAAASVIGAAVGALEPLVTQINPNDVTADPVMVEAHRQVLLAQLRRAPDVVGRPGGWSTAMVRNLALALPRQVERFGRALRIPETDHSWKITTPAEQTVVSDFRTIELWVATLCNQLNELGEDPVDLGSGFYLLRQAFGVIASSIGELRAACQYVQWTPEERDAYFITVDEAAFESSRADLEDRLGWDDPRFRGELRDEREDRTPEPATQTISFESLLGWIESSVTVDFPTLLDVAGLASVDASRPDLETQAILVDAAVFGEGREPGDEVPDQLLHPIVERAVSDLSKRLYDALRIAGELLPRETRRRGTPPADDDGPGMTSTATTRE